MNSQTECQLERLKAENQALRDLNAELEHRLEVLRLRQEEKQFPETRIVLTPPRSLLRN
jgi:hypothetical protein